MAILSDAVYVVGCESILFREKTELAILEPGQIGVLQAAVTNPEIALAVPIKPGDAFVGKSLFDSPGFDDAAIPEFLESALATDPKPAAGILGKGCSGIAGIGISDLIGIYPAIPDLGYAVGRARPNASVAA